MYVTYCQTSIEIWNFTSETQLSIVFLLSCIDRTLKYGLKSLQMVLHSNKQSEMVPSIFTIFLGGNHIQQLIILKVIKLETRCLKF